MISINNDIKTDHLISVRRPDFIVINNKRRELVKLSIFLNQMTTE